MNKTTIKHIAYILLPIAVVIFAGGSVSAASENELYKKALINNMSKCYSESYMYTVVKTGGADGYSGFKNSILKVKETGDKNGYLFIPTELGDGNKIKTKASNGGTQIGCFELFLGDANGSGFSGTMKGVFDLYGKSVPASSSDGNLASFVKGMGYTVEKDGSTATTEKQHCVTVQANTQPNLASGAGSQYNDIGSVCFLEKDIQEKVYSYAEITNIMVANTTNSTYTIGLTQDQFGLMGFHITYKYKNALGNDAVAYCDSTTSTVAPEVNGFGVEDVKKLADAAEYCGYSEGGYDPTAEDPAEARFPIYRGVYTTDTTQTGTGDSFKTFSMEPEEQHRGVFSQAYSKAYKYITGTDGQHEKFSDNEMFDLYSLYLNKIYEVDYADSVDCLTEKPATAILSSSNGDTYYVYTGSKGWCGVATAYPDRTVSAFSKSGLYVLDTYFNFAQLVEAMFNLNIEEGEVAPIDSPESDPGTEEQKKEPTCYDNAGSLGWVLCPIIDSLSKFILKLYVDWIEPSLVINAKLFDTTQNTGTYDAWCVFRDIANVLFVILFIFVIFSQLTGVGIDNYGIKKILPKLIVGAILINMSYIICQAVIDIANIVGHGIGSLFQSLSNQIGTVDSVTIGTETVGPDSWGSSFLSSAWNPIIVVVVAAFAAYTVLSQGLAIIIPALMLMISVAAAIFGLIAILGIRQALSVILVVFSPLAFACYMLPNTKPIFDKWYGGLKGVLIAYPICSAMIYGGDMVGNILMHAAGPGDTWLMISAAVISIAPVFFIPKVISASMGALSRGIMRVSGGIGNWGRGKLGRSGFAMDMQRRAQMQKAGIKFDKNGNAKYTRWGKIQNKTALTRGSKQRLDMQRRQAALGNAQMGQAGTFMGAAGLTRMTNMNLSAQAGQEEQDVRDTQTSIGLGKGESYVFGEDGKAEAVYDKNGKFVDYKREKVNASSIDSLQQGLRTALVTGNTTDIKAYQNMLAAKGDAGRQAIADAMTQAQASSAGNQKLTNAAVQAFSQNIMDNYAKDFKENARSTYNFANANQSINADNEGFSGPAMGSAEYMTKGSSLKSTQIGGMDDSELDSIVENIKTLQNNIDNGSLVGDDLEAAKAEISAARAAASGALSDSSIRGSIKQGNIDKLIEINGGVDPVVEQQKAQDEVAAAAQKTQDEQLAAINSINDQLKKRNNPPEPHIIITGHNRHLGDVGGKPNNDGASA